MNWTIEEGILIARSLEPVAIKFGYHVALGGGVLVKGFSLKDLDIFFYVHTTILKKSYDNKPPSSVIDHLLSDSQWSYLEPEKHKKDTGSGAPDFDQRYKEIKRMVFNNRRVDLIFLQPK